MTTTLRQLWRMARILRRYRRRQEVLTVPPIRIWVESASVCNLRCIMCPNKDIAPRDKGIMDLGLFARIVGEARGFVHDMYLHHRGEPFVNPALFDMIRCARKAGIRTRMHSNGALLDEERARQLIEAGPDMVSFSVDGFSKEAYEAIRIGATFEKTVGNVLRLAELKRERHGRRPYIVVERIRFKKTPPGETPEKIREMTERLLSAGVDEVITKEEYIWAEENAPVPEGVRSYTYCTFPWYAMVICWDGTVTPCPQDFRAKMVMGNARDSCLMEIWNGAPYRDLRRRLKGDIDSLVLCRKCDRLYRKTVGGLPLQYMVSFFVDHLVGYNRLRRMLGSFERN